MEGEGSGEGQQVARGILEGSSTVINHAVGKERYVYTLLGKTDECGTWYEKEVPHVSISLEQQNLGAP